MMFPLGLTIIGVVVICAIFGLFSKALDILKIPRALIIVFGLTVIACYILPDIRLGGNLRINIGGFIVPLLFSAAFIIVCRSTSDLLCMLSSSLASAIFILLVMQLLPSDTAAEKFGLLFLISPVVAVVCAFLNKRPGAAVLSSFFAVLDVQIYYSVSALFDTGFVTVTGAGVLFNIMILSVVLTAAACLIRQHFKSVKENRLAQIRLNAQMAEFGILELPAEHDENIAEAQKKYDEYYGKDIEPHEKNKPE